MRTTQASVNKWIKDGLIKPCKNSFTNLDFFDIDEVIDSFANKNNKIAFSLLSISTVPLSATSKPFSAKP